MRRVDVLPGIEQLEQELKTKLEAEEAANEHLKRRMAAIQQRFLNAREQINKVFTSGEPLVAG